MFSFRVFSVFFAVVGLNILTTVALSWHIREATNSNNEIFSNMSLVQTSVAKLSQVEAVSHRLNLPANEVFRSHNPTRERQRLAEERLSFEKTLQIFQSSTSNLPGELNVRLSSQLQTIQKISDELFLQSENTFIATQRNKNSLATEHMIQTDQLSAKLQNLLFEIRNSLYQRLESLSLDRLNLAARVRSSVYNILFLGFLLNLLLLALGGFLWIASKKERKIAEFYKSSLDQTAIVAVTDRNGNITYANGKFSEISGYAPEDLIGKNHRLFNSGQHPRKFFDTLWSTINRGQVWRGEIKNRRKDGTSYWVQSTIIPMLGKNKKIEQFISIRHDITERKSVEQRLIEAKRQAEVASKIKAQFLANMSHEIRTPLNAILGMATLLKEERLSADGQTHLQIMQSCSSTLLALINDILDFSKLEAGRIKLENVDFQLSDAVADVMSLFLDKAQKKNLRLSCSVSPELPRFISADVTRFNQILSNLLSNALKFTSSGAIAVSVRGVKNLKNREVIQVEVADTGIGIPSDQLDSLFQAFSQVDGSTTRRFGGTGLGLSISKGLCEAMGGTIWAQSIPNEGSKFTFEFLYSVPDQMQTPAPTPELNEPRRGANLEVLVADDQPTNQFLAKAFLERLSVKADIVNNGLEAVEAVKIKNYDVIFMDVHMPKMDGLEACARIRSLPGNTNNHPWIVALTASATTEDRETCLRGGMNDFITKPFSIEDFAKTLKREPAVNEDGPPLLNIVKLQRQYAGETDILTELIQLYQKAAPTLILKIANALKEKNAKNLRIAAHTLKGNVSQFFAEEVRDDLSQLELFAKNSQFSEAINIFNEVEPKLVRLSLELSKISDRGAA